MIRHELIKRLLNAADEVSVLSTLTKNAIASEYKEVYEELIRVMSKEERYSFEKMYEKINAQLANIHGEGKKLEKMTNNLEMYIGQLRERIKEKEND